MSEIIKHNDLLLGMIIRVSDEKDGLNFFTPDEFQQQIGILKLPKDHRFQPHIHNEIKREIFFTYETLVIRKGKLRVDFYDTDKKYLFSDIVSSGDILLLAEGGHGFKVLEEIDFVEVKQGPFLGEKDKLKFEILPDELVRMRSESNL
tara:strand:+ start:126 stop:569 length:444 start_codon:yes stop_codon:yes gene_type:complete